ncbi:hypothetical protein MKY59_12580 [Paenibacillus sp. FSL W8-0426]|uniref:hypothetical protein n=1 Tax=Paenibacillus sp. FSL W8-0426 TaxID=2921714 RepID=UPI0030DD0723
MMFVKNDNHGSSSHGEAGSSSSSKKTGSQGDLVGKTNSIIENPYNPKDHSIESDFHSSKHKSKDETSEIESTGETKPGTLDFNRKFPTRLIKLETEGYIIDRVAEL